MDQDESNITTMFTTTLDYLDENKAIWSGRPAFAKAATRAKDLNAQIGEARDKQKTPTKGVTLDKIDLRSLIERDTLIIADQLAALAADTGNKDLLAQVSTNKSSLDIMPEEDLETFARRIVSKANENIAILTSDYFIPASDVTELDTLVGNFAGKKTGPRQKIVDRKVQTMSLPELIAELRSLFRNQLDKLMSPFRKSNLDFYNGYFVARIIVNRAATHAAPKTATGKGTGGATSAADASTSPKTTP